MKRRVQILLLVMLALVAGGWGTVAAAMLCPHANVNRAVTGASSAIEEDHASCHAPQPVIQKQAHCHDAGMEEETAASVKTQVSETSLAPNATKLTLPAGACAHCLSRPEIPAQASLARLKLQPKSGVEVAAPRSASALMPPVAFTRPVVYRQGAPPGPQTPLHLLNSVILI